MPSTTTLRALIEAANVAARAMAQRRAGAGLAKKADDLLQIELFPPPEVVGGVSIPAPRLGAPGAPMVPSGPASPLARKFPRPPKQLDLLHLPRAPRTGQDVYLQEATRQLLPRDLAATAERSIQSAVQRMRRQQPKDVGLWRDVRGRPEERMVSTEDLVQESLRLLQARQAKLPATPSGIAHYLSPKLQKALSWQVSGLTRPVRLPQAERRIMLLEDRIRTAMQRDPRFAAFDPTPGAIFRRLAKDPGFAALLRREGGARYFGTPSGIERTLASGPPSAARDPKTAAALTGGRSPLDELLAKQAEGTTGFTEPMARIELAFKALTERQREVVSRVLGLGRPKEGIREVARDMKLQHPTVHEHYHTGLKKLQAALKTKPAPRPAPTPPAPAAPAPPKKTAKELVEDFLREAKRRVEARRRWEVEAPLRRMREQEPVRTWQRRTIPGETFLPTGKGKPQ